MPAPDIDAPVGDVLSDWKLALGNRMRQVRELHQLTQEQVGVLLGTSRANMNKIENGEVTLTLDKALRFCNLFNLTPDELLGQSRRVPHRLELLELVHVATALPTPAVTILVTLARSLATIPWPPATPAAD